MQILPYNRRYHNKFIDIVLFSMERCPWWNKIVQKQVLFATKFPQIRNFTNLAGEFQRYFSDHSMITWNDCLQKAFSHTLACILLPKKSRLSSCWYLHSFTIVLEYWYSFDSFRDVLAVNTQSGCYYKFDHTTFVQQRSQSNYKNSTNRKEKC